jgi:hypothetical protein
MTQPSRVLYLPPGVAPPGAPQAAIPQSHVPFDRTFFEGVLHEAIKGFCSQVQCTLPVVEVLTVDGMTHYVNGISGVTDQWVALSTMRRDHPHPVQVFLPYTTIFRVEIHPEPDGGSGQLGFVLPQSEASPQLPAPGA